MVRTRYRILILQKGVKYVRQWGPKGPKLVPFQEEELDSKKRKHEAEEEPAAKRLKKYESDEDSHTFAKTTPDESTSAEDSESEPEPAPKAAKRKIIEEEPDLTGRVTLEGKSLHICLPESWKSQWSEIQFSYGPDHNFTESNVIKNELKLELADYSSDDSEHQETEMQTEGEKEKTRSLRDMQTDQMSRESEHAEQSDPMERDDEKNSDSSESADHVIDVSSSDNESASSSDSSSGPGAPTFSGRALPLAEDVEAKFHLAPEFGDLYKRMTLKSLQVLEKQRHQNRGSLTPRINIPKPIVSHYFTVACAKNENAKHDNTESAFGIVFDEIMEKHVAGPDHPERPERVKQIMATFKSEGLLEKCKLIPARQATAEEILAAHSESVLKQLNETETLEDDVHYVRVDNDTIANRYTSTAARLAAGGLIELTYQVMTDKVKNGFAVIRPPGHHASRDKSQGFCFINNVAVAAKWAQKRFGVTRILILDWDAHHGNGTQDIFYDDPSVLYMSIHGAMIYPRTGKFFEIGEGQGKGKNINVAWSTKGNRDVDYYASFVHLMLPVAMEFNPELVFVSAGFDCAKGDPLGAMKVTEKGFAQMLSLLVGLSNGRVVCALEGGYDVDNTAHCAAVCLKVLMDLKLDINLSDSDLPSIHGWSDIQNTMLSHLDYWPVLKDIQSGTLMSEFCVEMKHLRSQVAPPNFY